MKIPYASLLLGPTALFALGFAMNAVCVAANHGSMPVLVPGGCVAGMISEIHSCMTGTVHLKFLADWILVRDVGVFSPGDFVLEAGLDTFWPALVLWVGFMIRDHNRN